MDLHHSYTYVFAYFVLKMFTLAETEKILLFVDAEHWILPQKASVYPVKKTQSHPCTFLSGKCSWSFCQIIGKSSIKNLDERNWNPEKNSLTSNQIFLHNTMQAHHKPIQILFIQGKNCKKILSWKLCLWCITLV